MADEVPTPFSLERWSKRKLDAARKETAAAPDAPAAAAVCVPAPPVAGMPASVPEAASPAALPPIESLTLESDFSVFMQPKIDEGLKRQALKKLFADPRFNVMDGLDVYIDDYSIPDPIPAEMVRKLMQSRYIFNPPQTRVNAQGFAEDVPDEEATLQEHAMESPSLPAALESSAGLDGAAPGVNGLADSVNGVALDGADPSAPSVPTANAQSLLAARTQAVSHDDAQPSSGERMQSDT